MQPINNSSDRIKPIDDRVLKEKNKHTSIDSANLKYSTKRPAELNTDRAVKKIRESKKKVIN